jgi:hypothetical protein
VVLRGNKLTLQRHHLKPEHCSAQIHTYDSITTNPRATDIGEDYIQKQIIEEERRTT